jgi:Mce-associated membrane protein
MTVNESQPRQQQAQPQTPQQQAQQQRARSRIATDGQTSRRPRPVAGQRAAAKRAATPAVDTVSTDTVSTDTALIVEPTLPEPREPVETVESEVVEPAAVAESEAVEEGEEVERAPKPKLERSPRPRTSTRRRAIVTAVLAVALIAAIAIGAVFTVQYRNVIRTDHARTAAMAAAERAAPVIFSYDYRHLDQDFSKAQAYLTGGFRDQYSKTTQTVVKPTALQYHGVVQAVVAKPADGSAPAVSVVSATPDQVVVLAFIDQSTTSTRVNGTQVDQNRVLLTLTHTSQGWLVSAVAAL